MAYDITIKIGGEAGQGIQTVGMLLAQACREAGLYCMAINDFESRIRGGHNFFQIRISDRHVRAPDNRVHLLVGLDTVTLTAHGDEVVDKGLVLIDSDKENNGDKVIAVPITRLAEEAGGAIMANTVAAAACLSLLGAPRDFCHNVIKKQFAGKSDDILFKNQAAADAGYQAVESKTFPYQLKWSNGDPKGTVITGDQAAGLGVLAADCRFAAFYPMSPSTSINMFLASHASDLPLVVEQVEDEIAAITMAVGASFAGVRAMTATSGGGFCLMTEALGLAAMTETPLVVINCQRPGPATGLPTRTGQGDLHFVIRASQDEFPRFVFAPDSPETLFSLTKKAFHLAEKYQVPAIVLADQYILDSLYTIEKDFPIPETVDRFIEENAGPNYKRFQLTDTGISPRALPCRGEGLVLVTANEHDESGHITESVKHRMSMVDKRAAKRSAMLPEISTPAVSHSDAETHLVAWGSTAGAVEEAVSLLRKDGHNIGHVHFTDLWPFPAEAVTSALKTRQWFVIEQNETGQLAQLIRQETGLAASGQVLKYDGRPFYVHELYDRVKTILTTT